jgi:hypothetical protein
MREMVVRFVRRAGLISLLSLVLLSGYQLLNNPSIANEGCAGLACIDGSDCGSACFCNRPSQTCYKDGELEGQ